jgi:hypothetical protein
MKPGETILFFNLNSDWLSDLLNRTIDSDIKVLNREGDRLNYHSLPCDRLNWHTLLNQWEDRKFKWNIIKYIIYVWLNNRFLHESLLKIWDFFHECEKFRLFTSGT